MPEQNKTFKKGILSVEITYFAQIILNNQLDIKTAKSENLQNVTWEILSRRHQFISMTTYFIKKKRIHDNHL